MKSSSLMLQFLLEKGDPGLKEFANSVRWAEYLPTQLWFHRHHGMGHCRDGDTFFSPLSCPECLHPRNPQLRLLRDAHLSPHHVFSSIFLFSNSQPICNDLLKVIWSLSFTRAAARPILFTAVSPTPGMASDTQRILLIFIECLSS